MLEADGHEVALFAVARDDCPCASDLAGFDLVCNHAIQAPPETIRKIAEQLPNVQFININHSALAHLERTTPRFVNRFTASIHSARQLPNVWYASQDPVARDVGRATGVERCVWIPTPGHELKPRPYREPAERPVVVIAGRADAIKNNLVQLIACALVRDQIRLVLCMEPDLAIRNTLHALQYQPDVMGLLDHGQWLDFLRTTADVVLCCSLAESYGFVAAEAMQTGVPVVASNAIKFAHRELTIDANTPQTIAYRISFAIDNHRRMATECAALASGEAAFQVAEYLRQINRIGRKA